MFACSMEKGTNILVKNEFSTIFQYSRWSRIYEFSSNESPKKREGGEEQLTKIQQIKSVTLLISDRF